MSIVEKMAEALDQSAFDAEASLIFVSGKTICRRIARTTLNAALTATGLTEDQLEGLANGTMVCVSADSIVVLPGPAYNQKPPSMIAREAEEIARRRSIGVIGVQGYTP